MNYKELPDQSDFSTYARKNFEENSLGVGKVIIEKQVVFQNEVKLLGEAQSAAFKDCYFLKDVVMEGANIGRTIEFTNCNIEGSLIITGNSKITDLFTLDNVCINGKLIIDKISTGNAKCNIADVGEVRISNCTCNSFVIDFSKVIRKIEKVCIENINEFDEGEFKLSDLKTKYFSIAGQTDDLSLTIKNICTDVFCIDHFRNGGVASITKVFPLNNDSNTQFSLKNSYLGATDFSNIDFNHFAKFYISNSHVAECTFVNVRWKNEILAFNEETMNTDECAKKIEIINKANLFDFWEIMLYRKEPVVIGYFAEEREVFRQLKFAMSKQGDTIYEQMFHGLEMKSLDRSLLWTRVWTKLIIKFSSITSDFGQSIIRPIFWLLIGHWLLFALLVYFNYFPDIQFSSQYDWNGITKAVNYFFETINPFRKTESGKTWVFIDLLMRIWASYMIYNFVRASRRFIK